MTADLDGNRHEKWLGNVACGLTCPSFQEDHGAARPSRLELCSPWRLVASRVWWGKPRMVQLERSVEGDQAMGNEKRRKLYIDRKIQGSLAVRILIHWIAFFVVSLSLTLLFHFLADPVTPFTAHIQDVLSSHRHFLIVSLVMVPAFVYDSIQLSNRFAGPILRFRRLIQEIGYGNSIEPLRFRDGDFWHDLSLDLNAMLDRLKLLEPTKSSGLKDTTAGSSSRNPVGAGETTRK
jgi:hypothetical protein